jgi:hypothetical protein
MLNKYVKELYDWTILVPADVNIHSDIFMDIFSDPENGGYYFSLPCAEPAYLKKSFEQEHAQNLYWAYLHKHGKIEIKEWYPGNTYLSEAHTSPNVKQFLKEPFKAGSFEEAGKIAGQLLKDQ